MGQVSRIVVVGGGLAGGKAVEQLRTDGYQGAVTLVCEEPHLPYERPPLSKGYLLGNEELEKAFVQPPEWYDDHDIDLRLHTRATAIDPEAHTVTVDGDALPFDRLLYATGSSPRHLPVADDSGAPVTYLRTIEDSQALRERLVPGCRVAVIGGGWIGLEVAAAARTSGCEVTVVEALEKPLVRVLGPEVADVFAGLHREHQVDLRLGVSVAGVEHRDGAVVVHLEDGADLTADVLVVGIGVTPNSALALAAGLEVDNGVLVDELLRSSHPDILAAGDVANAWHLLLGRRLRVEHWDTALGQGRAAARSMIGQGEAYTRLPYFFTDQYDLGMEYVGSVGREGYDDVVLRGDVAGRVFTAFWLSGGRVVAGMHANDWDAIDDVRRLVTAGAVDLAALRDDSVPLSDVP